MINGEQLAVFGELHPAVAAKYGFETRVYLAQIDLAGLYATADSGVKLFTPLPKFPAVERDLALLCDEDVPVAKIETILRRCGGKRLEKLTLFDVYQGAQIEKGKKSVAYSVWLRSADATLSDKDIDTVNAAIIKNLEGAGAELRK